MAIDKFSKFYPTLDTPFERASSVTTNDTVELTEIPRALYVGGAGNIIMRGIGDSSDTTWTGVPAGTILRFRPQFIRATGTTATSILALY